MISESATNMIVIKKKNYWSRKGGFPRSIGVYHLFDLLNFSHIRPCLLPGTFLRSNLRAHHLLLPRKNELVLVCDSHLMSTGEICQLQRVKMHMTSYMYKYVFWRQSGSGTQHSAAAAYKLSRSGRNAHEPCAFSAAPTHSRPKITRSRPRGRVLWFSGDFGSLLSAKQLTVRPDIKVVLGLTAGLDAISQLGLVEWAAYVTEPPLTNIVDPTTRNISFSTTWLESSN